MSILNRETLVVILGGGRGDRLFPLTKMRSKPAVPLAGRYRLIDIPVSNCLHSGLNRIFVLTQFNSASLNQHISRTYNFDSFSNGFVEVLAAEQTIGSTEWFQGTADAVRKIFPHIMNQSWERILILSGDHLYRMNYEAFLEHHIYKEADVSVCVVPVKRSAVHGFGLLKVDATHRIVRFIEKPKGNAMRPYRVDTTAFGLDPEEARKRPFLASMGIYIFSRGMLENALFDDPGLNDFGRQIIPDTIQRFKVFAFLFKDYWEDIGTIRSYFDANMSLCQRRPPFKLFHPTRPFYTRQRHLPGSTIIDSRITNSIINDGCLIQKSTIKNSVVGLRSSIQAGSTIRGSLLMGADYYDESTPPKGGPPRLGIGSNTRIVKAIVDKNARIGSNVVIENRKKIKRYDHPKGLYYIREGIVIVAKNAVIPDNMVI
jgi:glucose-1-phosphate adenylyltransferase